MRITKEQFLNKLKNIRPNIILISDYKGMLKPAIFKNIENDYVFEAICCHIFQKNRSGTWWYRGISKQEEQKIKNKKFLESIPEKFGNIKLLSDYINQRTKIYIDFLDYNMQLWCSPAGLIQGTYPSELSKKIHYIESVNEVQQINPKIKITGNLQNPDGTVECTCLIDGYVWSPYFCNLKKGGGCPVCNNKVVMRGVNDIATTASYLVPYIEKIEDAYTHTKYSNDKIWYKCPDCGNRDFMIINNVSKRGFTCKYCSDKISYPNKFSRALLSQLPLEYFKPEYSPEWIGGKSYDNYFIYNGKEYILEMDGGFHYVFNTLSSTTSEDTRKIDEYKDIMAIKHNITIIRIDCRKSTKEYIMNHILDSQLNDIFDLSKIDWDYCDKIGTSNFYKYISDIYNSGIEIKEICKLFSMTKEMVQHYLRKGNKLGFCSYGKLKKGGNGQYGKCA